MMMPPDSAFSEEEKRAQRASEFNTILLTLAILLFVAFFFVYGEVPETVDRDCCKCCEMLLGKGGFGNGKR